MTPTRELMPHALRPALWGALGLAAVLGITGSPLRGGGFLAGALWNIANLWLLHALALAWGREQRRRALLLLAGKLLILYPAGLALAMSGIFSLVAIIAGFSWPFLILVVYAAWPGRATPAAPAAEIETPRV